MKTKYELILETEGLEAAKEYMRNIRRNVNPKNIKGRPKKANGLGNGVQG